MLTFTQSIKIKPSTWLKLALALVVWLVVFQGTRLFTSPLAYDDAYLAAAAKSLALGYGYATHYPESQAFDVRLGVGPILQLPAAGLMVFFGNEYWVPGLATILLILVLLAGIATQLRLFDTSHRDLIAAIGLMGYAAVTADREEWMLSHWYALLGDIPASLAVTLGVLLVSRDIHKRRAPGITAGLVLGMAIQIKLVALLGVVPAAVAGLWVGYRSAGCQAFQRSVCFVCMIVLPSLLAQIWQLWALGGAAAYVQHATAWYSYFQSDGSGSGLSGFGGARFLLSVFSRITANARSVTEYLGGGFASAALLVLALLLVIRLNRSKSADVKDQDGRVISGALLWAAFAVHTSWWLLLSSTGWINHLLPGLLYLAGVVAIVASIQSTRWLTVATWVAIAIVIVPRLPALKGYWPSVSHNPGLHSALEVHDFLLSQKPKGSTYVGCGWWVPRDLEYLLPDVGNFKDCLRLNPDTFAASPIVLVRSISFWNWQGDARLQRFAENCERMPIFRNAYYVVSRCVTPP